MRVLALTLFTFIAVLGVGNPSPAVAAKDTRPVAYAGVWKGSIGNLPVRACFTNAGSGPFGAYFYMSRLVTIPLIRDEKGSQFFSEGWPDDPKAPRWELVRVGRDVIDGTWKQGRRALPLHLVRIPAANDDGMPCASMAFHQPRMTGLRTVRSRAVKDGVSYTKLTLDHRGHFPGIALESFELDGNEPAVKRINGVLNKPFGLKADEDGWLGCITNAFAGSPWNGDFDETFEPTLISPRWLSVRHSVGGFCGGAHPDSSSTSMLFDRKTGAQLEPLDWFSTTAVKREDLGVEYGIYTTLKPALIAMILKGWKPDDSECYEATNTEEGWDVGVVRGALVFSPNLPHVVSACIDDYKVSFERLQPWLTPAGKRIVATLPR